MRFLFWGENFDDFMTWKISRHRDRGLLLCFWKDSRRIEMYYPIEEF